VRAQLFDFKRRKIASVNEPNRNVASGDPLLVGSAVLIFAGLVAHVRLIQKV
jgi:hypothetical protein